MKVVLVDWELWQVTLAVPIAFALTIVSIGVATTLSEFLERRLRRWWTGKDVE
jgi:hypothetical protein